MKTKNSETLLSFITFCLNNPDLRFWQALRAWAEVNFILVTEELPIEGKPRAFLEDTFYWEGRRRHESS